MAGTIRARFTRGMLEPLERVDLPEGKEVALTIIDVPSGRNFEAFRRQRRKKQTSGQWQCVGPWGYPNSGVMEWNESVAAYKRP